MKLKLLFISIIAVFAFQQKAFSQKQEKLIQISIDDNTGTNFITNSYRITNDSLIITCVNYKNSISYTKRKLNNKEQKSLHHNFETLKLDSLKSEYFSGYENFKYIDFNNYPHIISLDFKIDGHERKIKVTNKFDSAIAEIINELNKHFPPEVQIKYSATEFEKQK